MASLLGKILLLIILIYFSSTLITADDPWIFLDGANFAFHELGHLLFIPFGQTAHFLGGTFFQLLIPISIGIYFFFQRSYTGVAFCIFWIGDNLINIGRYFRDARALLLPIHGGGIHDWNWLLFKWNLLEYDLRIGSVVHQLGSLFLVISIMLLVLLIGYELSSFKTKSV